MSELFDIIPHWEGKATYYGKFETKEKTFYISVTCKDLYNFSLFDADDITEESFLKFVDNQNEKNN